jgi:outer membrane lipoprotein-sorting protein
LIPRGSLIALIGALCLGLAAAGPACAQASNPLEWLFGKSAAPEPERTPAEKVPLPPRRPASLKAVPAQAQAETAEAAQPTVAEAPATTGAARPASSEALPAASRPIVAAAASAAAPAPSGPLSEQQIVAKANAYFNSLSSLVGDFVQTGGDGRRLTGKLYLQRPGKIRFEYDAPATIEVVADGSSVAVRDRKLATQDLYSLSQTPLKFLLRERIDLGSDIRIVGVSNEPEGARLALEDRSTLGGTSKITLFFDHAVETLQRWRIVDPQGFTTIVALSNLDRTRRVDNRLFVINYERMLDDKR